MGKPTTKHLLDVATMLDVASDTTTRGLRAWFLRMLRWGGGASNAGMIASLMSEIGLRYSRRILEAQGDWLASRGYLTIRQFEMVTVYELTRLGDDVARGLIVDGEIAAIQLADVSADEALITSIRSQ